MEEKGSMDIAFEDYERLFSALKADPCDILGVSRENLTKALVRSQYKRKIRELHPDRAGAKSEAACKLLNAAYAYLKRLASLREERSEEARSEDEQPKEAQPHPPGRGESVVDDLEGLADLKSGIRIGGPTCVGTITKWAELAPLPPSTDLDYARVRQAGGILLVSSSSDEGRLGTSIRSVMGMANEPMRTPREGDSINAVGQRDVDRMKSERAIPMAKPTFSFSEACAAMERERAMVMTRETLENRRFIEERSSRFNQNKRAMVLSALSMPPRRTLTM
jgi:curved DNA-binding protein CbpA